MNVAVDPVRYVAKNMRLDLRLIAEMIAPGTRVLDIGCGDGALIEHLFRTRGCDARGIEIDMAEVTRAVAHGLPVMHGDADIDLAHYPDARVRLRGAVAHLAGGGAAARGAAADAAHRRRAPSSAFPISAIGWCAGSCCGPGGCR